MRLDDEHASAELGECDVKRSDHLSRSLHQDSRDGSRTHTEGILSPLPLPLGYPATVGAGGCFYSARAALACGAGEGFAVYRIKVLPQLTPCGTQRHDFE